MLKFVSSQFLLGIYCVDFDSSVHWNKAGIVFTELMINAFFSQYFQISMTITWNLLWKNITFLVLRPPHQNCLKCPLFIKDCTCIRIEANLILHLDNCFQKQIRQALIFFILSPILVVPC